MAIHDLLWGCPLCGDGPLSADDRCLACGARYRRGRGDRIVASGPAGKESRSAAEWLDRLPAADAAPPRPQPVRWRHMEEDTVPVRFAGELIGWVERFGAWTEGTLTLLEDVLRLQSASDLLEVPIADLRTVQPVSGGFQLRTRDGNVLTVRFDAASVIRWERLLQGAVRRCWERLGRGAVSEFQPCIRAG